LQASRVGNEKLNELGFSTSWEIGIFEEDSELGILKRKNEKLWRGD